jgi:hypothetical protein
MTVPYLVFENTEVANSARTLAYLRQFLPLQVQTRSDPNCSCPAIDGTWGSPYSDPAPWFDASRPESQSFYGLLLDAIALPPVLTRPAKLRANGGQSLGALVPKGRTIQASGAMYGASEMSLEYGTRWLAKVLSGDCEDPCGLSEACLLPACPDTGQPARWRHLYGAGLIDGPTVSTVAGSNGCIFRTVAFQLGAEAPYLFADPVVLLNQPLLANTNTCGLASTTQWIGDSTTKITVSTGGPNWVTGLQVSAAPLRANETCPSPSAAEISFTIAQVPPGAKLVIDGRTRTVQVLEMNSGLQIGGLDIISTGGVPLSWIDIGPCARACICVRAATVNSTTTVRIEQIDREI